MFSLERLCKLLTKKLAQNIFIEEEEIEIIEYGFHLIISETSKLLLTLIIMNSIGFLYYSIFVIVTFGVLRNFLGGVHAKTHIGCFISYLSTIFLIVLLGKVTTKLQCIIITVSILPYVISTIKKYAPADTQEKPIVSEIQRKHLRKIGLFAVIILIIFSIFINSPFSGFIIFTIFAETILMRPAAYKLFKSSFSMERN
ncbi:MAG: accessory gene regulator B family protein [Bacillota bacterium]|nr:accessory gene regulator B family protein [Bacillota bacterium]